MQDPVAIFFIGKTAKHPKWCDVVISNKVPMSLVSATATNFDIESVHG